MIQKDFANRVVTMLKEDARVIGLAAAGSWITDEIDAFSDLDLVLVTRDTVAGNKTQMLAYAQQFGKLLNAFTGEHVGEPRLLICLYDDPLLHVDIKFLTLPEFHHRVENPVVLLEKDQQLTNIISNTTAAWPYPDYQWLEDRFWTWVHYGATKLGRGEYFETMDMLAFLRARVLAPLLQVRNGLQPRGMRRLETNLPPADLDRLMATVPQYKPLSLLEALRRSINLYRVLRDELYPAGIILQSAAEKRSMEYLEEVGAHL
ncbi:aminoglycoside 6-adenylyltransferase [Chitinophaga sp. GbtcB8]|uniref:aminoglycoside 6-adenylyltransferase n=1 Tax=Chitinophaga sp. GbtcB8 TaxID=2824753 RepID=UPI001C311487|nr:aminoglycoside 6-adenylyltransferase [Chitinophaga sp. GbtcB8]